MSEAAKKIGVSRATLYRWIKAGKVATIVRAHPTPHRALRVAEIERIKADREQGKQVKAKKKTWAQTADRSREDALRAIAQDEGIDIDDPAAHQELSRQLTFSLRLYRIHREYKIDCDAYMQLLEDDGRLGIDLDRLERDRKRRAHRRRIDSGRK